MRVKSNYMLVYHLDFALSVCAAFGPSLQLNCRSGVPDVHCYMGIIDILKL